MRTYPASEFDAADTAILYGPSGSGKTTLAATWPKPLLLVNIKDDGIGSIKKVKGVDVVDVFTYEDLEEVRDALHTGKTKYKTVVLDTITQLQDILVQEKIGGKDGFQKRVSFGTLKRGDWGDIAGLVKSLLLDFRNLAGDLGINVIFLAQQRVFNAGEDDDVAGIQPEIGPGVSPSIKNSVCASVNIVANTYIDEKLIKKEVNGKKKTERRMDYCLGLGPSAVYTRKVRADREQDVPDHIVDPTYSKLNEAIGD